MAECREFSGRRGGRDGRRQKEDGQNPKQEDSEEGEAKCKKDEAVSKTRPKGFKVSHARGGAAAGLWSSSERGEPVPNLRNEGQYEGSDALRRIKRVLNHIYCMAVRPCGRP